MKNKTLPFSVIIFFGIIFLIFFKGLKDTKIYTPNLNTKKEVPSFNTKGFFSGKNVKSSGIFKLDKIYLLNIWSSWCVPCRQEHSVLMNLSKKTDLNIVGLNYKDKKNNAIKFLKELGNPFSKILIDPDGIISISLGAYGVPETFLLNNKSKIIKKYIGPLTENNISEIIKIIK